MLFAVETASKLAGLFTLTSGVAGSSARSTGSSIICSGLSISQTYAADTSAVSVMSSIPRTVACCWIKSVEYCII